MKRIALLIIINFCLAMLSFADTARVEARRCARGQRYGMGVDRVFGPLTEMIRASDVGLCVLCEMPKFLHTVSSPQPV